MRKKKIIKFYEHLHYPGLNDEKELFAAFPLIRELKLKDLPEMDKHFQAINRWIDSHDYDKWIMRYKNRLRDIRMTYLFLAYSHSKGIPDQNWNQPREDGGVNYLADFSRDEDHVNNFLFNYYSEYIFYQVFSSYDILHQCLNKLYSFNLDPKKKDFNKKILQGVKPKAPALAASMETFLQQTIAFRDVRNTFTHSFPVNEVDLRSKPEKDKPGTISMGMAYYTTSDELVKHIQEMITQYIPVIRAFETQMDFLGDGKDAQPK